MDEFDFAPYEQYALDPVEWRRKMFIDLLDAYVTEMLYVLNDNNMTVTIFGDPEMILSLFLGFRITISSFVCLILSEPMKLYTLLLDTLQMVWV